MKEEEKKDSISDLNYDGIKDDGAFINTVRMNRIRNEESKTNKQVYYGNPVNLKIEMTDYEATMLWDILNESILNCPSETFKAYAKKFFTIYQEALLKAGLPNLPKSSNGSCLS